MTLNLSYLLLQIFSIISSFLSPMELNNFLHHFLTGFPQVPLVVWEVGGLAFTRVDFTALRHRIKTVDEVPCIENENTVFSENKAPTYTTEKMPRYRWATPPSVSMRYFCPTSFIYSSMALVASVFSLKISASLSPRRSTSAPPKAMRNSWKQARKSLSVSFLLCFISRCTLMPLYI